MRLLSGIATLLMLAAVSGCGGSSNNGNDANVKNLTGFVKSQLATTSETRDPVNINRLTFRDKDADNEQAFDDVLEGM